MNMSQTKRPALVAVAALLAVGLGGAQAAIPGLTGTTFNLTAKSGYITTPEANRIFFWGFANGSGPVQYPGPTLIVSKGASVQITLTNELSVPVSIVFPGQTGVQAVGGNPGLLTAEAAPGGGTVTYSFTADEPGTYLYHSGTRAELQIEMGLVGALIVRSGTPGQAYDHPDSAYDNEVLFLQTEMDPRIHQLVETGRIAEVDNTTWFPTYWFLNGRCFPDTLLSPAESGELPNQPYSCAPMMHPGDRLLQRYVNAGRAFHPFHPHKNHVLVIARDGRLFSSAPGAGADLTVTDFTITVPPGGTADAIFTWTGAGSGWDFYGHVGDEDNDPVGNFPGPEDVDHNGNRVFDPLPPLEPFEDPADHGMPFPVILPERKSVAMGSLYGGSPFLGQTGHLPPGVEGLNPAGVFFGIWHSHHEREIVNNDAFPGGMITFVIIFPPSIPLP